MQKKVALTAFSFTTSMDIHRSKAANKAKFTSLRTVVNNFVVSLNVFVLLD